MTTTPLQLLGGTAAADESTDSNVDWRSQAACRGRLELFFARKAERPQARNRRHAKAKVLCDSCSVFEECRTSARNNREYGYWAGESEEDRHLLGFRVTAPIGVRARAADKEEKRQDRSA